MLLHGGEKRLPLGPHSRPKILVDLHRSSHLKSRISTVGNTTSSAFPMNGELESLFFKGFGAPHAGSGAAGRLGTMWRSMIEDMFDFLTDEATGRFDFTDYYEKYEPTVAIADRNSANQCMKVIRNAMMTCLFGDPSLRVGGVASPALADTEAPTSTAVVSGDGTNRVVITFDASDTGSPASGVKWVHAIVDGVSTLGGPIVLDSHGPHTVSYWAEDYMGGQESPHGMEVTVDAMPPTTTLVSVDGTRGSLIDCPCDDGTCAPDTGCFEDTVTVTLAAGDADSGVQTIQYWYAGMWEYEFFRFYTGPFVIPKPEEYPGTVTLKYTSFDNAGNRDEIHEVTICFCGLWVCPYARMSLAPWLRRVAGYTIPGEIAASLPSMKSARLEYGAPANPEWKTGASDSVGSDGWSLQWPTDQVPDSEYIVRVSAFGPPGPNGVPMLLHRFDRLVNVCNFHDAEFVFEMRAPEAAARGETIDYRIRFSHKAKSALAGIGILVHLDPDLFESIKPLDGGTLDKAGRPVWSIPKLEPGTEWTVRAAAKMKADIPAGTRISAQAAFTAEGDVYFLSDDPATLREADASVVKVAPTPGSIAGTIRRDDELPIAGAAVTISGAASRKATSDKEGKYSFDSLTTGKFKVAVAVPNFDYRSPKGPEAVELDGSGKTVTADFRLVARDITPPASRLSVPAHEIVQRKLGGISGAAVDFSPGSGIAKVEVRVRRNDDGTWWDGAAWRAKPEWLAAKGTESWRADLGALEWKEDLSYTIEHAATDGAGNREIPAMATTSFVVAPALLSPAAGASVGPSPTLEWTAVPGCSYQLQVARTVDFGSPVIDRGVGGTRFAPEPLPAGVLYWRVRALRPTSVPFWATEDYDLLPSGGPPEESDWSAMRKFTIKAGGGGFRRGDANADATTDISDAVAILGFLFLGSSAIPCEQAADCDDSTALDITDAVYLLNFLFLGGKPPNEPFAKCGTDATTGTLTCGSFKPCN